MNTGTRSVTNVRRASAPWPGFLLPRKREYQDRSAARRPSAAPDLTDESSARRASPIGHSQLDIQISVYCAIDRQPVIAMTSARQREDAGRMSDQQRLLSPNVSTLPLPESRTRHEARGYQIMNQR